MADWTADQLTLLHEIEEVLVTPIDDLQPPATARSIWILELDGRVFVRSWKGPDAEWYRRATATGRARISTPDSPGDLDLEVVLRPDQDEATAAAIVAEYGRKYTEAYALEMDVPEARITTVELIPA